MIGTWHFYNCTRFYDQIRCLVVKTKVLEVGSPQKKISMEIH